MSLINVNNLTFSYEGSFEKVFENATFQIDTDWKLGLIGRNGKGKTTFLNLLLGKYEFKGNITKNKDIKQMSEGQKKKVLLAKSISEMANLYIWDEPLNYIDILTRIQIEEAILKYKPTLIFVEHDETFTQKIATKVIHLKKQID